MAIRDRQRAIHPRLDAEVTVHLVGIPITGAASTDARRIAGGYPAEGSAGK